MRRIPGSVVSMCITLLDDFPMATFIGSYATYDALLLHFFHLPLDSVGGNTAEFSESYPA